MFRKILFYLYYIKEFRFQYFNFIKEYFFIKKNIYKSINHNLSIQKERLFDILNHAIHKVPYYKKIAHERDIKISKDSIFEDIKKFPILTKEDLRNNWNSLHTKLNYVRYSINTSGGTTGEPVKFIQSRKYKILNFCGKSVFNEFAGYYSGDKLVKLWGNEKDILYMTRGIIEPLINKYCRNIMFQNSFKMSEPVIYQYIKEINLKKPKVMLAYVQSVYEMAKFLKQKNLKISRLNSIITSAGVLTPDVKVYLENIFKTKVYNRYGSREISVIGSSCEKSDKIHINMYHKFIEILDDTNNSLNENQKGNIIITDLINYSMPLIRYKIGDRGSINFSKCLCRRGLIRLNNVIGRVVDIFKNEYGEFIDGEFFTHLFYFQENIKQFQVIQEKLNEIHVNLVPLDKNKIDKTAEKDIAKKIKIVMGKNCKVIFNYVNDIEPSYSGKIRYTISKL